MIKMSDIIENCDLTDYKTMIWLSDIIISMIGYLAEMYYSTKILHLITFTCNYAEIAAHCPATTKNAKKD